MDYEQKYKEALAKAREFQKSKDGLCVLTAESIFPELKESEDDKIRKALIRVLNENVGNGIEKYGAKLEDALAWLEKQKVMDKEIIFRPLAGTDIIVAAKQALEKIEIGKEVILAFNGAYIPVNGKTVAEICNEYFAWSEKQSEKKHVNNIEDIVEIFVHDEKAYTNPAAFENSLGRLLKLFEKLPKQDLIDGLKFYTNVVEHDGEYVKPTWSDEDDARIKQLLGWIDTLKNYIHYDALVPLDLRRERMDKVSDLEDWLKSLKERLS